MALFHFNVDIKSGRPPVTINLIPIRGNFNFFLEIDGREPTPERNVRKNEGSRIVVNPDDDFYKTALDSLDLRISVYSTSENPKND